ncbi:MAG: S41 family peptidase [Patescibacteria group bacterium]
MQRFKVFFNRTKYIFLATFFVVGFFFFGIYVGQGKVPEIDKVFALSNKEPQVSTTADFAPFWKVWNTINEKYPNAKNVSDQDRVYGAIKGLTGSLNDPYSTFFVPDETKMFEDDISGEFSGVGMEVGIKDKILTVIAPLKNTPAYNAGVKSGDKILKIDKTVTSDLNIEQAIKLIRGEKGTTVSLTIYREGVKKPLEIKIVRDVINTPTLDAELNKEGVFVINLYSFSANSANLFKEAMEKFLNSGSDKLLLDLRGNPGGYLDASVDMASWFLPSGKTVVIEDYGNDIKPKTYRSHGYDIFTDKLKFVILIDSGSASASEILAGAMQDYKIAKLVGEKSYGKGSVQEVVNITPDTIFKITVAKWLTPLGRSISEKGLEPDYKVTSTEKDIEAKRDAQKEKAIEILNNWK